MFLALRYQPGFGPLAVAYAAANIASAIPLTPGGLGVIEVTLVAITVGFGAPRATAVLAVLGYRIVNYWLPLPPGAVAYLRLRLRPSADGKGKAKESPQRRSLADRIPSINFLRTRRVPRVAKHFADRGWAAYPTLKQITR